MIRIATCLALAVLALSATAQASGPTATAAKTCNLSISQERNSGATYLVQLKVSGAVNCATGLKVEKAWQACRRSTAGHMTCHKRVLGYKSTQKLIDSGKTQYDARVTATNGGRNVTFVYTQNK